MCVKYVTIQTQIYGERGFPLTATPLTLLDPDNPYLPQLLGAVIRIRIYDPRSLSLDHCASKEH